MSLVKTAELFTAVNDDEVLKNTLKGFGISGHFSLSSISGGGNNRLYKITADTGAFLLKHYFKNPGDPRDRLHSEFSFMSFLWEKGIRCIPRPINMSENAGMAIYEYIKGECLSEITENEIGQALDFFSAINLFRSAPEAESLAAASEACFSIKEHLDRVEKRIESLGQIRHDDEIDGQALQFVSQELQPAWQKCSSRVLTACERFQLSIAESLQRRDCVLSPSDFGFHNAIKTPAGALRFIDFEYGGWDDPAKTVGDFFSQVSVPVPLTYFDRFKRGVGALIRDQKGFMLRSRLLLPAYRVKWCCIVLNHFLPVGAARRGFASGIAEKSKSVQLNKAQSLVRSLAQLEKELPDGVY